MTMAPRPARHQYSYDEYLAYERDSWRKHEYDGGEIIAMAGGSRRRNALASRVSAALENAREPLVSPSSRTSGSGLVSRSRSRVLPR